MKKNSKSELQSCASEAADFLRGLANETRLLTLCALLEKEKCVSELLEELSVSQSLLSQHLKRLREEGILETRRDAQRIYYGLADTAAEEILRALAEKFRK